MQNDLRLFVYIFLKDEQAKIASSNRASWGAGTQFSVPLQASPKFWAAQSHRRDPCESLHTDHDWTQSDPR